MHLHLPKAIHGWREFAKEVGIIVLGVLIALGSFKRGAGARMRELRAAHWRVKSNIQRCGRSSALPFSSACARDSRT